MRGDLRRCPRCKGNGWDPKGGTCQVCDGAGIVSTNDTAPVSLRDADAFFDDYYHRKSLRDN
jgi:DnaJ-class molecular chaperone